MCQQYFLLSFVSSIRLGDKKKDPFKKSHLRMNISITDSRHCYNSPPQTVNNTVSTRAYNWIELFQSDC